MKLIGKFKQRVRVGLVSACEHERASFEASLGSRPAVLVVASGPDFGSVHDRPDPPDVIIAGDGAQEPYAAFAAMIRWMRRRAPLCVPVTVTRSCNPALLTHLYRIGARHLVERRDVWRSLEAAATAAHRGSPYFSPRMRGSLFPRNSRGRQEAPARLRLTIREAALLRRCAFELGGCAKTGAGGRGVVVVQRDLASALEKLGARDARDLRSLVATVGLHAAVDAMCEGEAQPARWRGGR